MAYQSKRRRTFQPGDLVLVRKQVTSKAVEGKPAKLTLKARRPYQILEAASESSHFIQRLPVVQGPGKRMKELAMRMERLPSSLVVHKRVTTLDTKLAEVGGDLVSNPMERKLGFYDFGRYTKAPDDAYYAFEKLNESWDEETQSDKSDKESLDESVTEPDKRNETTENESTKQRTEIRTTRNTNRDGTNQNHLEIKRLKGKQNTRNTNTRKENETNGGGPYHLSLAQTDLERDE